MKIIKKTINKFLPLVLATCAWPVAGHGENWSFDPRVEVGAQSDDNYRLLPSGFHDSVSGGYGDVRLDIHTVDPVNELRFSPGVHSSWFPNSRDDQSTDPYADFVASHRGQKSTASVLATYIKESVVKSDRVTTDAGGGLGSPDAGDSGFISLRNKRELVTVLPAFTYDVTQRDTLNLNLSYSNASYDKFIPNTNVGYMHAGAQIGVAHAVTERHSFGVSGFFTRNDPDTPPGAAVANGNTNSYGVLGEWRLKVSDVSQAYARAGVQRSKFDRVSNTGLSAQETTYVAGAGVNWSFQVTQLFLDLTRTVDPSSTGYSIERNQVRLRASRNLSALLSGFVAVRAFKDKAADPSATFRARTYSVASVGLEKRFLREWSVRGEYDFTHQDFENGLGPGNSNAVLVSIIYEPRRETQSVGRYRH